MTNKRSAATPTSAPSTMPTMAGVRSADDRVELLLFSFPGTFVLPGEIDDDVGVSEVVLAIVEGAGRVIPDLVVGSGSGTLDGSE